MPDNIASRPYHPKMACEACCFGRGEHAEWCEREDAMVTVDELLRNTENCAHGVVSLEAFERWFDDNTSDAYADPAACEVYEAIESVLAEYHFDHIGESAFRKGLANAIRPFEERERVRLGKFSNSAQVTPIVKPKGKRRAKYETKRDTTREESND